VDYDQIPSPRLQSSSSHSRRQSVASVNVKSPGPSRLSRSFVPQELEDGFDDHGGFDDGGYDPPGPPTDDDSDNEPMRPPPSPPNRPMSRRTRPTRSKPKTPLSARVKGKQRQSREFEEMEDDQQVEDEIERGLADVENDPPEEEEDREETPKPKSRRREENDSLENEQPASKKARTGKEGQKKPRGRPRKENVLREVIQDNNADDDDDDSGLRRGQRKRYKPLEWWRLEKVVYGRRGSGTSLVPTINE